MPVIGGRWTFSGELRDRMKTSSKEWNCPLNGLVRRPVVDEMDFNPLFRQVPERRRDDIFFVVGAHKSQDPKVGRRTIDVFCSPPTQNRHYRSLSPISVVVSSKSNKRYVQSHCAQ